MTLSPARSLLLPRPALRALHSGLADWLTDCPNHELRDGLLVRIGGMDFTRFAVCVGDGRLIAGARLEPDDTVTLTLSVPVVDGHDWTLVQLDHRQHTITADWLRRSAAIDIEDAIERLQAGDQ